MCKYPARLQQKTLIRDSICVMGGRSNTAAPLSSWDDSCGFVSAAAGNGKKKIATRGGVLEGQSKEKLKIEYPPRKRYPCEVCRAATSQFDRSVRTQRKILLDSNKPLIKSLSRVSLGGLHCLAIPSYYLVAVFCPAPPGKVFFHTTTTDAGERLKEMA